MNHDLKDFWSGCQLEKKLGEGSYGEVYLETCNELNEKRCNAAKIILLPGKQLSEEALQEGRPEERSPEEHLHCLAAEAGRRLNQVKSIRGQHNVAFLEDYKVVKTQDGYTLYLRSELLTPIEEYLQEHAPTDRDALRLCLQISEAIECFGSKGLFHQNIKPSNLFVDEEGNFKLGDCALPMLGLPQNEFAPPETTPEGSAGDDLFSLCAVVRKLFAPTGRLAALCDKACHPQKEKRFQSVEQFQEALCRISPVQAVAEYSPPPPVAVQKEQNKKSRRALVSMFLLGVLLVTCIVVYGRLSMLFLTKTEPGLSAPNGPDAPQTAPAPDDPTPPNTPKDPLDFAFSEDGGVIIPNLTDLSAAEVCAALEKHEMQVKIAYELNRDKVGKILNQNQPYDRPLYRDRCLWLLVGCADPSEVTPRIQSITFSSDTITLSVNESIQACPEINPPETADLPLKWSSSDDSILLVEDGLLTALKEGSVTLLVQDETELVNAVLTVTVSPAKATVPDLLGEKEEDAIHKLKQLGLFTSVSYEYNSAPEGTVIAQSPDADKSANVGSEVQLTVSLGEPEPEHVPVTQVILSHAVLNLNQGEEFKLEATLLPSNASNSAISWLSSDRSVATVNADGTVIALSDGTAVIRAISADGSKSDSCTVTVVTASYTVVYNANGGTGTMEPSTHVYGKIQKLSDCSFTRTGFAFSGWAFTPDATDPKFINNQTVGNLTGENGAEVILYAVWSPMEYAITYDANGGRLSGDDFFFVTFEGVYGTLAVPEREGYEFAGWYSNRVNGIRIQEDTPVTPDSPTTLYAHWRKPSQAVAESELPENAEIIPDSEYWTYTKTTQKSSSKRVNTDGWKLLSVAEDWLILEEKNVYYAVFPEGFDRTNELFTRYVSAPPAEENSAKRKVEYLKTDTVGSLYWHWAQPQQSSAPSNAAISEHSSRIFSRFSAFESSLLFPTVTPDGLYRDGLYYNNRNNSTDGSFWWYRIPVQSVTYRVSEFTTVYTYEVTETLRSDTLPTEGDNVTRWVQYYVYE